MHGTATKLKNSRKIAIDGAVKGETNFDGNTDVTINVTQDNIAVVSGNINVSASDTQGAFNGTGNATIAYPTGYTKDNCKILSVSTALSSMNVHSTGSIPKFVALDMQRGIFPAYVSRDASLRIKVYNASNQEVTVNYEIILIKN